MKFSELGLHPLVQAGVDACGFVDCTPIQESTIPHILSGKDIAGLAQTGTGKTAAFVLPLMDRVLSSRETELRPQAFKDWLKTNFILVLVPTRELAEQVCENVKKFGASAGIRAAAIYGGTGYEGQKAAIRSGVEFIVATPGRLIDLYKEHLLDLGQVRAIVFDEADRMFDMGFKDDMKYILRRVPQDRQFLVFSATLNFDVLNTSYEFGANPVEVNVSRDQAKADNVNDEIFHVGQEEKPKYLLSLIQKIKPSQVIIFSNFKHNVDRIANFLTANGMPAMGISSLISQQQRTRIMELFRNGQNNRNILVATDVAARGLDIKGVDLVINYELPDDSENYVHRIGRTGRAGAKGHALSLVSDRDVEALQRIESYLGHKVTIGWMEEVDLVKEFKPFSYDDPHKKREFRGDNQQNGRGPRKPFRDRPQRGPHPQRGGSGERPPRDQQRPYRDQRGDEKSASRPQQSAGDHSGGPNQNRQDWRRPKGPRDHQRPHHQDRAHSSGGAQQQNRRPAHHHQQKPRTGDAPRREMYRHKPAQAKPGALSAVGSFFKKLFGG